MSKYILFLHENPATFAPMSPDQMQAIIQEYRSWKETLMAAGKLKDGQKLRDEGGRRIVRREGKLLVTDGPYAEAKDVLGGLFVIEVASYDEAVEIGKTCPHIEYGEIEVREIDDYTR